MRQIFLLVVFVLAARWLVKTMRAVQTDTAPRGRAGPGAARGPASAGARQAQPQPQPPEPRQLAEPVVRCAVCGVHAPKSESIAFGGQYFCGVDHARRHAAPAGGREGR